MHNMWQGLFPEVKTPKMTISEIAKYTSKEDVMKSHGWLVQQYNGTFKWQHLRTSRNCASGNQLASYFGVHKEWLDIQII